MKNILLCVALGAACGSALAQTTTSSSSGATSGSMAIGGGAASLSSTIGGSRSISQGGTGGAGGSAAGGAASSNVTVNLGTTDPSGSSGGADPVSAAQQTSGSGSTTTHIKESVQTVGNPGAVSYGVSFSQFNCANTASLGAGFLGGVFQFGGGVESQPCNDRANASALFQIAGALQTSNAALAAQLYRASILLIGNSTKETQAALKQAGVADWQEPAPTAPATSAATYGPREYAPTVDYHH